MLQLQTYINDLNFIYDYTERIIVNQLHEYLVKHNIFTPAQFSFQHGHSTYFN